MVFVASVCHVVYPFAQTHLLANVYCDESGLGPLVLLHHQYWTPVETCLSYLVVAQSHGHPAGMVPQDWPLHALWQLLDGVNGQANPKDLGLGGT